MIFIERTTLSSFSEELAKRTENISKGHSKIDGISTGFDELDNLTMGFKPGDLTLITGVDGMGKTHFLLSLIQKIVFEKKYNAVFFSLQMSKQQVLSKILCQQKNISENIVGITNINEMENFPLYLNDFPALTVSDIEETLSCVPPDFAKIIMLDSLELLSINKKDKVGKILNKRELTKIVFKLKNLALKLNIPIVLLSNLKLAQKEIGKNLSRRPTLLDLRTYAPIDTYADLILLLYRPEYYKIKDWDDEENKSTDGEAEIIIAKSNYGKLANVRIKWNVFKDFI
ncbi:DnaB helicase-like protein [Flavobacterium sp. 270]|nr:DnaB helicase-like protein [Flavobacterium sp. 270]